MADLLAELAAWTAHTGIAARAGDSLDGDGDFRRDPRVDFGRYIRRVPAFVLAPRSLEELSECVRFLARVGLPYKIRGTGHSAGGQTLSDGGAVLLTSGLDSISEDDAAGEQITVGGGVTWLALLERLQAAGRRPLVLTDNLRTTVAGTLSVGGFGDASHLHGAQAEGVTRLVLVTPDGVARAAAPGDTWFDHALYGRGRLGIIAAATLRTTRLPSLLCGRLLEWRSLREFVADAIEVAETARYQIFRARLQWDGTVWAVAGNLAPAIDVPPPAHVVETGPFETLDLMAVAREDPHRRWSFFSPNLELVLPLPSGIDQLGELLARLEPWVRHMPRGASVMVLPSRSRLPLAPLPRESDRCLLIALRPELPTADEARACVPFLRQLGARAIAAGARLYAASIDVGEAADATVEQLAHAVDPARLCNR